MYDLINIFEVLLPQLLLYPNPTDPLNSEAANLLLKDPTKYKDKVKDYVKKYAQSLKVENQISKDKSDKINPDNKNINKSSLGSDYDNNINNTTGKSDNFKNNNHISSEKINKNKDEDNNIEYNSDSQEEDFSKLSEASLDEEENEESA
jgi:hypothetical protein